MTEKERAKHLRMMNNKTYANGYRRGFFEGIKCQEERQYFLTVEAYERQIDYLTKVIDKMIAEKKEEEKK